MNTSNAAKKTAINAAKLLREPFETLRSQAAPFVDEFKAELGSFMGSPTNLGSRPQSIAQEELQRARNEIKLQKESSEDEQQSNEKAQQVINLLQQEYHRYSTKNDQEQKQFHEEVVELQGEIAKLAKTAGVETKAHLANPTKKIGVLEIKFLTQIIRFLTIKAEESKSAKDLQAQRQNAKRTTGMQAWISGKQMKVHEQGTLHLQG